MAGKTMVAVISLEGRIDPSLAKSIKKAEAEVARIGKMKGLSKSLSGIGSQVADLGKSIGSSIATGIAVGASAAAAGLGYIATSAVQSYAQYEQLVGGVDTLFKDSSDTIQSYAAEAYRTAGVSANTYMEQATAFSAALIQSLGGDTQAAAGYADMAIKDMSDNANKMGTSIESIQQTYQSLMRGNYAMLDNLKLGYGGTKSELERLVADASELTGEALDPAKFSDVITAIHAVQDNMGITGTTAQEAATTIEGSVNSMKASWDNWLTGLGRDDADMGELTDQLIESLGNVADNLAPVAERIAKSLAEELPGALAGAINAVGGAIGGVLGIEIPEVDAGDIASTLSSIVGPIAQMVQTVGPSIAQFAQTVLPPLVNLVQQLIPPLTSIVSQVLPPLISTLGPLISYATQIISSILPPLTQVIQALIPPLMQVVNAIMPPLLSILQTLIPVISQIASFIGGLLATAISALTPIIQTLTPVVQTIFGIAQSLLNTVIIPILSPIMQLAQQLLPLLGSAFTMLQGPLNVIVGVFGAVAGAVQSVIWFVGDLIGKIGEVGNAIANSPIGQFVGGAVSTVGGWLGFAHGGFTTGPYIAGEDPRYPNEAVLSFNPAYRAQNVRYWERAGHLLGVSPSSASASTQTASGGATYDFSGMTFAPKVEVRGNASKDDIIAAIKQCEGDFVDFVLDALSAREEAIYA